MKSQNSSGVDIELTIAEQPMPFGRMNYYLSFNGNTYEQVFFSTDQITWTLDNRPQSFVEWLDSLDTSADGDYLCSKEAYAQAIAMGKKTGRMSDYVRVDGQGNPLPRSMQC